jgi:uncharacterized repeat protein (TIGR03806 family)
MSLALKKLCVRILLCLVSVPLAWTVDITTQAVDIQRTGANTQETLLTLANVNQSSFGKLFTVSMNANVNSQTLYVHGLTINGGVHNVLFAYTSNNSTNSPCGIYAFDADIGGTALWSRTLTNAAQYTTNTPVIDTSSNTMYFVTKDINDSGSNWLHAVNILTGAEQPNSPIVIAGSVSGSSDGGSTVTFPDTQANCRPGLLLLNNVLYLGFAFNSDALPYHGWVFAYSYSHAAGFTNLASFCVTRDQDVPTNAASVHHFESQGGGVWAAGKGLASDGTNIFCTTGNGNFTAQNGGRNYAMCALNLAPNTLAVQDWFAETNAINDSINDADLGNCGFALIPGTTIGFVASTKYGKGHLIQMTNMGHWNATADTCLQTVSTQGGVGSNPVAWNGGSAGTFAYLFGGNVQQWQLSGTTFSNGGSPIHTSSAGGGGSLCVSSNGTSNGILWAVAGANVVHAYDATNVTTELWNSSQNSARDSLPSTGHFQFPIVANGIVYVPTGAAQIVAYGRLATQLSFTQQPSASVAGATINPSVTVSILGNAGAVDTASTASVTIAISADPSSGTLSGTLTVAAINGVATFPGLSINNAGVGYTLIASSAGLTSATSSAFTITSSATSAAKLAFVQQPTTTLAGSSITPSISVAVQDSLGNTVTGSAATVTLAIGTNPSAGFLTGTAVRNAVNGIATFPALSISPAGVGYTIAATSSGLTSATSGTFTITAAPAATPTINPNGGSFTGPVTITLADASPGVTIYYSTSGTVSTGSAVYNSAMPPILSLSGSIQAIAAGNGFASSAVASATFAISGGTPYGVPSRPIVTGLNVPPSNNAPPATLSATGVFSSLSTLTPAPGIIPYAPNVPLWSDNAAKMRWIALPGTSKITFQATGEWAFPGGTIFIKHFQIGIDETNPGAVKRLETRLLVLNPSGTSGYGITYQWRPDNSDADLLATSPYLTSGLDQSITIATAGGGTRTQTWHYPSQNECLTCHTSYSGFVLGPKTRQLNGLYTYPSTGISDNQLRTWNYLEMFTTTLMESAITSYAAMQLANAPTNTLTLQDQVKSYLDANCANCHRPSGVNATWDARYDTLMANQNIINGPVKNSFGVSGAAVVVPQSTAQSMMHYRMNALGSSPPNTTQMPPLDRMLIDSTALSVVDAWIINLPPNSATSVSLSPSSGSIGTTVLITGTNLTSASQVFFNGTSAIFSVISSTQISATVPNGATSGLVTVTVTSGTLTSLTTFLVAGPATQLVVLVQPATTTVNHPITPAVQVAIEDANGIVVSNSSANVTLSLATNPSAASLAGTLTAAANAGIATFAGLAINQLGDGYTLSASCSGLASVVSLPFNVVEPAAGSSSSWHKCGHGLSFGLVLMMTLTAWAMRVRTRRTASRRAPIP